MIKTILKLDFFVGYFYIEVDFNVYLYKKMVGYWLGDVDGNDKNGGWFVQTVRVEKERRIGEKSTETVVVCSACVR